MVHASNSTQKYRALDWIVLKVSQRCNLNCSYCYVYNRGDSSWAARPALISQAVVAALALRISEHCDQHDIRRFTIELHGGEPLLLGISRFEKLIGLLRAHCTKVELNIGLQTNGLLLNVEWLHCLARNRVPFSVSLDGPPSTSDRFRVGHDGLGKTATLIELINELRRLSPLYDQLNTGYLSVIAPDMDGGALVRWMTESGFSPFDLLLPDGNWFNLPQRWDGPDAYSKFLIEAFDAWYAMGNSAPDIRLFRHFVLSFFGRRSGMDALGGDIGSMCVVETDGTIQDHDVLRVAGTPSDLTLLLGGVKPVEGLSVFSNALDEHRRYFLIDRMQRLCQQCSECLHLSSCGGGYLPHRFDGSTFQNPSLYCEALYALADHVGGRLRADTPVEWWQSRSHRQLDKVEVD